jgi:hypothetical protein
MYYISSNADRSGSRFSFVIYIYQSTACILVELTQNVLSIIQRRSERLDVLFLLLYINQPHIAGVECTQKCIIYHRTPIGATRAFRLFYIIQLPLVEWSVPKIYYISSNANRLDVLFLLLYQSTACSGVYEWSVPKINCISSNADQSDSRFSFVIYQSTAYWSGAYPQFIIYHPMPIGATHAFLLLYINQLPTGVERTQNLLHVIQRRSTRCAFSFVISLNCL